MITNSERHAVASMLRGLNNADKAMIRARMDRLSNQDLGAALVFALGFFIVLDRVGRDSETCGDLWTLLADLMEPPTAYAIQRCPGAFYECSACGQDAWVTKDKVTRFCPNCGAEVVE